MRTNDPTHASHTVQPTQDDSPLNATQRWFAPTRPGKGKRAWLAFIFGFLLGPIGIGLYLRSVMDALLLLCVDMMLLTIGGDGIAPLMWLVGGLWGFMRVRIDSREPISTSETPEALRSPEPEQTTSPPAL